ncbi:MAG TPA: hypothetical protein DDZ80_22565 [Cyanobacteria bacterium UBA8803]|nr:hypothetical protein [Cyanobacteria bacterium UBA9273]HBL61110.1 hypothetical protein [Cyanobacteria bacterium UBA8803]
MPSDAGTLRIPLTNKDREALEALFKDCQAAEIDKIEEIVSFYCAAPLDPREERGWVINSCLVKLPAQ